MPRAPRTPRQPQAAAAAAEAPAERPAIPENPRIIAVLRQELGTRVYNGLKREEQLVVLGRMAAMHDYDIAEAAMISVGQLRNILERPIVAEALAKLRPPVYAEVTCEKVVRALTRMALGEQRCSPAQVNAAGKVLDYYTGATDSTGETGAFVQELLGKARKPPQPADQPATEPTDQPEGGSDEAPAT
jgi:hypothetical protein